MISITDKASFFNADSNTIICNNPDSVEFIDSNININGEGNIIVIENGAKMKGCVLKINGDNSLLYLSKSKHWYYLDATVNNNTAVYFGKNCYFNGRMTVVTSERQNVFVGKDGLFSYGICIRTADPHLVYDCNTKQRLNHSASVLIGDHVWLGQAVMLLKGTQIGSGSIIGAGAVCAGKKVHSNTSFAGNPARLIRENVFFTNKCVHSWTEDVSNENETANTDEWIYSQDKNTVMLTDIDNALKACKTANEKLNYIQNSLPKGKNRFYIAPQQKQKKGLFGKSKKD